MRAPRIIRIWFLESSSANPALSTGAGDGADWDADVFTVARGLYNGTHTDRFFGHIDDVHITQGALAPEAFLYSAPSNSGLAPAQEWRLVHFGKPDDSGQGADDADPDGDGTPNLLERAFGGNPLAADPAILPAVDPAAPLLSIGYRKSHATADLEILVQETTDLSLGWSPAVGSEAIISDDGEVRTVRFTRPAGSDEKLFLRLRVSGP